MTACPFVLQCRPVFTAMLIALLIVAGAATVVGGSIVFASRRKALAGGGAPRQLTSGSSTALLERGFTNMRIYDVIQYNGQDFLVEAVIHYDEAGHRWSMAHMVDGRDDFWLLVGLERTGSSSKRLLHPTSEVELNGYPPEMLIVDQKRFRFDKRGTATAKLDGNTGSLAGDKDLGGVQRCRWWSYDSAGDDTLLVEQWGDDYRMLVGHKVGDTDVEMMPGS